MQRNQAPTYRDVQQIKKIVGHFLCPTSCSLSQQQFFLNNKPAGRMWAISDSNSKTKNQFYGTTKNQNTDAFMTQKMQNMDIRFFIKQF